jgi:hypothetical protein
MRRSLRCLLLVVLVVAVGAWTHPVARSVDASSRSDRAHRDVAGSELGRLVSGTASYVDGRYVWTDYVLDDRGPNLVETGVLGPPRCSFPGAPDCSGGDAVYPAAAAPGNTADLVQLQIGKAAGDRLSIRAILGSLVDPDVPVLGIAFDTDAQPTTGASELPGGRWPAVDPLGIDTLIVASNAGAQLWQYSGSWTQSPRHAPRPRAVVDAEANTIDVAVHKRHLPPMTGQWRAFAVLGVRNDAGGSWFDGGEEIFDLAFVADEPFVQWQDMRQADILAGPRAPTHDGLSSTQAAALIDWAKIDRRTTELADGNSPGFHTYLFRSSLDLPEGTTNPNPSNVLQHEYLGRYQPYLVYVPDVLPPGDPLTVWLHGANNNHMQSIFEAGTYVGTARAGSEDFFLIEMFQPDALINIGFPKTIQIYVLGRGETLGYAGISEIDVLEATDDAMRRFDIDPNRVTLEGASMGGIGSYRLGTLYPDRWAAIIPVIGTGVSYRDLFVNLRNVPVRQMNGRIDNGELGPPSEQDAATLDTLGYDHRYFLANDRGHEVPGFYNCVFDQTATQQVRNPNPHQVVYRVDPARFQVDPARDVDIRYSGAYWVSGIEAGGASPGTVAVTSNALPHSDERIERATVLDGNTTEGRDLCGPNPLFAPGWSPAHPNGETWIQRSLVRIPGEPQPLTNMLDAQLTNVAAVTFDVARAGIDGGESFTFHLESDRDVAVTLVGMSHRATASLDGGTAVRADREGSVTVTIPAGTHSLESGS